MSNLTAVTNEDFEQAVIKSDVPVLVDFYADWCGPCKTQTPILGEISSGIRWKGQVCKSRYRCRRKQRSCSEIWRYVCAHPHNLQQW